MASDELEESQQLYEQVDPKRLMYHPVMLEELTFKYLTVGTRVLCHGHVIKITKVPKLLTFKLCDSSAERECSVFSKATEDPPVEDHKQIVEGAFLAVMGVKQQKEHQNKLIQKVFVHRYTGSSAVMSVIDDADEQMEWAVSTIKASREQQKKWFGKGDFKPRSSMITNHPLICRSALFRSLFKITEDTPELNKITISVGTILKNRNFIEECKKVAINSMALEESIQDGLREFADVHFVQINEQPNRKTKYVVYHKLFRELLTKILEYIQNEKDGVTPELIHTFAQKQAFGDGRSDMLFDVDCILTLLKKMQVERKIYRASDGKLFAMQE